MIHGLWLRAINDQLPITNYQKRAFPPQVRESQKWF